MKSMRSDVPSSFGVTADLASRRGPGLFGSSLARRCGGRGDVADKAPLPVKLGFRLAGPLLPLIKLAVRRELFFGAAVVCSGPVDLINSAKSFIDSLPTLASRACGITTLCTDDWGRLKFSTGDSTNLDLVGETIDGVCMRSPFSLEEDTLGLLPSDGVSRWGLVFLGNSAMSAVLLRVVPHRGEFEPYGIY